MAGFGSRRRGGAVTAERAAAYVVTISSLAPLLQQGKCLTAEKDFAAGKFPVVVTVDLTTERHCFVELIHPTRDPREGDRLITDIVYLVWTVPTFGGRRWWFLCPRTAPAA